MDDQNILEKRTPDGRIVTIIPLTYGRARLTIGTDWRFYDRTW